MEHAEDGELEHVVPLGHAPPGRPTDVGPITRINISSRYIEDNRSTADRRLVRHGGASEVGDPRDHRPRRVRPRPRRRVRAAPLPPAEPVANPDAARGPSSTTASQRRAALLRLFSGGGLVLATTATPTPTCSGRQAPRRAGRPAPARSAATTGLVHRHLRVRRRARPLLRPHPLGDELPAMAYEFGAFSVYVVEVCQRCRWNSCSRPTSSATACRAALCPRRVICLTSRGPVRVQAGATSPEP